MGLECREKRKEEAGLICCRALPAQGGVTSSSIPMLKQGQCKGFLAEKQNSSSLSEQDIFKNKAVAIRLAAFIDTLLA